MDDFDKLINAMVEEGKKQKPARKKKTAKSAKTGDTEVSYAVNPWTDEALVLVATNRICDRCGNEALAWEQSLYIERINTRPANPIRQIERLDQCNYAAVYGALPKRTEFRTEHSCACPQCFGIGDNRGDDLAGEYTPVQLQLNFGEVQ